MNAIVNPLILIIFNPQKLMGAFVQTFMVDKSC